MEDTANVLNSDTLKPFFIENISKFCDKCGNEYRTDNIGIISETNSSAIIQAQCPKCKAMYMAHIVKPLQITKKIPIRLDISPALIKPYFESGPISADEVLDYRKKILKAKDIESLSYALGYEKKPKQNVIKKPKKQNEG